MYSVRQEYRFQYPVKPGNRSKWKRQQSFTRRCPEAEQVRTDALNEVHIMKNHQLLTPAAVFASISSRAIAATS